ncbi:dihydrodipicolinate synthase family protein [Pseudonocardia humida]|uniref:Dihydrodipicolinate synthase family protein n=1 Tax=Pseudonocardia humida TaxID=2800819 RepID=A0ABT1A0T7_9PSEU|nr:dihydrodipicolinate synthase family protein [Pseudonocardia humida]MCO1656419.1 dihydrodipicolinate synthase family protein [Pseudonocardia humida]
MSAAVPREGLRGVLPVAPTVFRDDESLDLHGQRRVAEFLVDAGSAAICVLANFSEQFSLTDAERLQVLEATLDQVAGRVPVIVTTSSYSARITRERNRDALQRGAAMVMVMAPFFGATMVVPEDGVLDYFRRVADGLDIEIMLQDAPMSPTPLPVPLIARLAREVPQVRHAKIEVPRTAAKVRALRAAAGDDLPGLYDGEEAVTLVPDLDAGVLATMSSATVPEALAAVVARYHAGDRAGAVEAWERVLPLIHYENRQCGLAAAKILLAEGGVIGSARTRAPFPEIGPRTREELLDLARSRDALALRWA